MDYIDTNILVSIIKSKRSVENDFLISEFTLIELERIKILENLKYENLPLKIIKIKKLKINFEILKTFSKIILDKSYLSDFIHLEICKKFELNFLTKDKRLARVLHLYPNLKVI